MGTFQHKKRISTGEGMFGDGSKRIEANPIFCRGIRWYHYVMDQPRVS